MIYLQLFNEYFKTGLFAFGGGYATLPFLYHISETYGWYTAKQLSDMIAISSVTPGPVGVNVATFSGYTSAGIVGALIATFAVILPSIILVIFIAKILSKFKNNKYVISAVNALKPAGCGMLVAVAINLVKENVTNSGTLIIFLILAIISLKIKKDVLVYLGISAFLGFLFVNTGLI